MAFIVETGSGTPGATAYATPTFVDTYLTDAGRETENSWSTATTAAKQAAIVAATRYIDTRWGPLVKGLRLRTWINGRKASATATFTAVPLDTETVTVGAITYRFVTALAQENDVLRGASVTDAAANLAAAISSGGNGTTSHELTLANLAVDASSSLGVLTVTAQQEGRNGNSLAFTSTVTGATLTGSGFLADGEDEGPQPLIFPRQNLVGWDGELVEGIPLKLREATAEYAVRALASTLAPDLTVDATGARVQRKREKVGPIEEETVFAEGAVPFIFRDYPAADRLLAEYVKAGGGVIR